MSRSFIVAVALLCAASVATVLGCEDDEKVLVGEGGACASIVDCQPGLSCVATSGDARVCKTAATSVPVGPEEDGAPPAEAGADTSAADAEADATTDDATTDDAADASPVDAADAAIVDASDAG